jgi:hypothetical protein
MVQYRTVPGGAEAILHTGCNFLFLTTLQTFGLSGTSLASISVANPEPDPDPYGLGHLDPLVTDPDPSIIMQK